MLLSTIIIHISLAIILFFMVNWIGKHSISIGYVEITIFSQNEDNPAFNFLIRVLSPQVFLIIVSTILYSLDQDNIVRNIYLVNIYYVIFRFSASVLMGRIILLNWYKQILYWIAIVSLSYILYENIIKYKKSILPDFTTMSNELWIIILVFVYQIINKLDFTSTKAAERRENYISKNFLSLKKKYGRLIHGITGNEALDIIVYGILIYEDFNRPRIVRWIEYLVFFFKRNRPRTLGIMQYRTNRYISDKQSVQLGTQKIFDKYRALSLSPDWAGFENDMQVAREIIIDYNGGESYIGEVINLMYSIKEKFYGSSTDELVSAL